MLFRHPVPNINNTSLYKCQKELSRILICVKRPPDMSSCCQTMHSKVYSQKETQDTLLSQFSILLRLFLCTISGISHLCLMKMVSDYNPKSCIAYHQSTFGKVDWNNEPSSNPTTDLSVKLAGNIRVYWRRQSGTVEYSRDIVEDQWVYPGNSRLPVGSSLGKTIPFRRVRIASTDGLPPRDLPALGWKAFFFSRDDNIDRCWILSCLPCIWRIGLTDKQTIVKTF